jgi:membrane protease YdiL (CAAX protease family)
MSITPAASSTQAFGLIFSIICVGGTLVIVRALGVWRNESVIGPDRWRANERPSQLAVITLLGMITWLLVQSLYGAFRANVIAPTVQSAGNGLSVKEIVLVSAAAQAGGALVLLIANAFRRDGIGLLGLRLRQLPYGVIIGVLGLLLTLPFVFGSAVFNDLLWKVLNIEHAQKHELLQVLDETKDRQLRFWAIATAVVIAPIAEELFFRGHIQTLLVRMFARRPLPTFAVPAESVPLASEPGAALNYETPLAHRPEGKVATGARRWAAIIVTSLIFAIIHPWWTIIPIFVLALALGYVYERTGNLWTVIALHMLFNTSSVVLSSYA